MHATSSGVFNNNSDFPLNSRKKKIARNCVQHNDCVFRVELDESQCRYIATGNFVCLSILLRIVG